MSTPTLLDDTSSTLTYSGPWRFYSGSSGLFDATSWHDGSFASCGGNRASNGTVPASSSGVRCDLRVPFEGTSISLYGDTNPGHGVFSCRLERQDDSGQSEAEGTWGWFYGGSQSNRRPYQLNATLCSISGIPSGKHTLVLGVEPDQVQDGIAFDYASFDSSAEEGSTYTWSSLFNHAVPPSALRNTTATPSLPASTSSSTFRPSGSPSNTGKGLNVVGLAVGVSLGGACAIAAAVIFFLVWRKRQKRKKENRSRYPAHQHEREDSGSTFHDGDSVWYPGRSDVGALGGAGAGVGAGVATATAGGLSKIGEAGEKGHSPASGSGRGTSGFATLVQEEEDKWHRYSQDSAPTNWRNSKSGGTCGPVYARLSTGGAGEPIPYYDPSTSDPASYSSGPPPSSLPYSTFPPTSVHAPYIPPHYPLAATSTASFASTLVTPAPIPPPPPTGLRTSLSSAPAPVVEELPLDAKLADPDEFRERG
ncbi:hypothetical protein JCM11251_005865 [Rhodosporidiobolus azoricus]